MYMQNVQLLNLAVEPIKSELTRKIHVDNAVDLTPSKEDVLKGRCYGYAPMTGHSNCITLA